MNHPNTSLRRTSRVAQRGRRGDAGYVSAFTAVFAVALLAVAGLVLDGGLALSTKVQALDTAGAAARAGAQHLDLSAYRDGTRRLDQPAAAAAARSWLSRAGATGTVTTTPTTVTVTVTASRPAQLLRIVGVSRLTVSASATSQAVHGVSGATP
ncbi:MAG TPA: pilus assembly protein TadG-related protein [Pilimelia sp.]|nr:pilus assembly protein TadG-related protein [Pilimelia sp.]